MKNVVYLTHAHHQSCPRPTCPPNNSPIQVLCCRQNEAERLVLACWRWGSREHGSTARWGGGEGSTQQNLSARGPFWKSFQRRNGRLASCNLKSQPPRSQHKQGRKRLQIRHLKAKTAPRATCPRSLWGFWRDDGSRTFPISPHRPPRPTPQQLRGPPGIRMSAPATARGSQARAHLEVAAGTDEPGSPLERRADFWGEGWREGREGFEAPDGHAPLRRALQRLPGRREVSAGRTAGPPRGPGHAAAGGGRPASPRSALPAATLAGAKGRRQASQRTRLRRGQRAGAMAAPGAAGEPRGRGCLRGCGRCSGRAARAMRGGAGAALARPRLATLCRCAPPPPTARRADPGPRQPRRAPSPRPSLPSPHPSFPHEPPPP